MSRCYPYPFFTSVQLALSPKKEKHKHKDKKKKRRKDSETNVDVPRDWDKRSKKAQQSGVFNEGLSLGNGSLPETKVASSEAVHEKITQRLQADSLNSELLSAGVLAAINSKGLGTITKQGSCELSLVSVKAACNSNGAVANEAVPLLRTSSKSEVNLRTECHTQFIPRVEKVWSALDDQEWLHHNKLLLSVRRCKLDEGHASQVLWAEAVLLPSVGIYALPYVVPD